MFLSHGSRAFMKVLPRLPGLIVDPLLVDGNPTDPVSRIANIARV